MFILDLIRVRPSQTRKAGSLAGAEATMLTMRTGSSLVGTIALAGALALFGALLFPVLVTAGERSPQASCQSNLREIGAALMMYMEDYDGTAPLARSVEIDSEPLVREGGP